MQFALRWVGKDTSPTVPYNLSFPLKGTKQPEKINIETKSSQGHWQYDLILYLYLVEQPSIWEKHQMIIMIITFIVVIIIILGLLLYFFPDLRKDTMGKAIKCKKS